VPPEPLEGLEVVIVTEQRASSLSASRQQRIQSKLAVIRLPSPTMAVLRPVVDEQQHAGRRQALDQRVEQPLGLRIQPVEVLKHNTQGLDLAFAQQHPSEAVDRPAAALARIQNVPGNVVTRELQEREEGWHHRAERFVECQELPVTFSRMLRIVVRVDPK
jgi:hypothetical protein